MEDPAKIFWDGFDKGHKIGLLRGLLYGLFVAFVLAGLIAWAIQ